VKTVEWVTKENMVRMIDQRRLPGALEYLVCKSADEVIQAICSMAIRGAPAIGVAGAYGLAVEAFRLNENKQTDPRGKLQQTALKVINARPTAVNLAWAVQRILGVIKDESFDDAALPDKVLAEAEKMAGEDVAANLAISQFGADLIDDGDTIIHHCNTGSLAVVEWGTALGVIRYAHDQGKNIHVLIDETRPRLQGSRLTAWECGQYGISYDIITDNAAGYFLHSGKVQKIFFGADRVTVNGDVVNKVGTYMLSLAAHANAVPVICVFPTSTLDLTLLSGNQVNIEERSAEEVLAISYHGEAVSPTGATARNPAFDITPHELITAMVTEVGIIHPPFLQNLASCVYNSRLDK
jgi:methylthioribose-1-phosphate isomerase